MPTNQINAEYPYEKSAGPTYVRDIVKGSETDSRPPKHAFGSYGSKWNSPTPSLPGLCPSSYDTVGSGYGSLDYSSGTDQSHETLPASNRRVLVAEDKMKKSSIRKGRRMNKPKPCPKSSNRTEQLPLVPEDISTRGEENGLYSEEQLYINKIHPNLWLLGVLMLLVATFVLVRLFFQQFCLMLIILSYF